MTEVELELLENLMHAEHELGRWKKRCADLDKKVDLLLDQQKDAKTLIETIQQIFDATLIQITLQEGGIAYQMPNVREVLAAYRLHASADDNGIMTLRAEPTTGTEADHEEEYGLPESDDEAVQPLRAVQRTEADHAEE